MRTNWPANYTPELASQIAARSAKGEGVIQVCKDLGLNADDATLWLKEFHIGMIISAKKEQITNRNKPK